MGLTRSHRWINIVTSFSVPYFKLCSAIFLVKQDICGVFKMCSYAIRFYTMKFPSLSVHALEPIYLSTKWISFALCLQLRKSPLIFFFCPKLHGERIHLHLKKSYFGILNLEMCSQEKRVLPSALEERKTKSFSYVPVTWSVALLVLLPCTYRLKLHQPATLEAFKRFRSTIMRQQQGLYFCYIYPTIYLYFQPFPLQFRGILVALCLGLPHFPVISRGSCK